VAKNKGTFGKAKSDVEIEDEFIESAGRVATALKPHTKSLIIGASLLLVAGAGIATWDWTQKKASRELTHEMSDMMLERFAPVAAADSEPVDTEGFATAEARSEAVAKAAGALAAQGKAGVLAKLYEADSDMRLGKYAEAEAAYRAFLAGSAPESVRVLAREGIGYAIEAKALAAKDAKERQAGLEAALKAFEAMQPDVAGPAYKRGLYHQARMLAALDRRDDAIAKFREILNDDPGDLEGEIENRLAALTQAAKPNP